MHSDVSTQTITIPGGEVIVFLRSIILLQTARQESRAVDTETDLRVLVSTDIETFRHTPCLDSLSREIKKCVPFAPAPLLCIDIKYKLTDLIVGHMFRHSLSF